MNYKYVFTELSQSQFIDSTVLNSKHSFIVQLQIFLLNNSLNFVPSEFQIPHVRQSVSFPAR